ncbi:MAG TPA: DUF1811 family protein [Virgibacillus sp.]|nr:DUF1811 family protein [Virgibacillus sp.]HLR66634.1 DUF1811 family protein [Virgibacillus sp.]
MAHPYKRYSIEQLQAEEELLREKLQKAEALGQRNYIAVHRRKIEIVRSYMLDASAFRPGDMRELMEDHEHYFKIDEVSGVVAWGHRIHKGNHETSGEREAVLLDLLGEKSK